MSRGGVPSAMSIDPDRPVSEEFRRVLLEELHLAIAACESHGSWEVRRRSEAIRRTRKALKRFRAVLDLVKGSLPAEDHEAMRIAARDFGRRLSPLRDRDVVLDLLDGLGEQVTGRRRREAVRTTGAVLSPRRPCRSRATTVKTRRSSTKYGMVSRTSRVGSDRSTSRRSTETP